MFLVTGVFGFLQPFVPLYLTGAGLTNAEYGMVAALGTGTGLLVQPVLGRLSDRYDARRPFMVAAAVCAGCAYLTYPFVSGIILFTLLTAAGVNGFQYLNAVGGVLLGRMAAATGRAGGATYVAYRIWGSVGYICVGIGAGLLLNPTLTGKADLLRTDLDPVFHYGPLLFFATAIVALLVPDRKAAPAAVHAVTARVSPPTAPTDTRDASASNFTWFLRAYFLYQFSLYGASAYLPVYMRSLGATPLWITGMFAAGVICEVLVMTRIGRWTDAYGRRPALALSMLLMPLRMLLYIPATGPLWVLLVQSLHGINFGIVGTIAIVFVNDLATDANRGSLQARLAGTAGLALALGPIACGWIADRFSLGTMFAAMSLIGFVAAAVFLVFVRESHSDVVPHRNRVIRWLARAD